MSRVTLLSVIGCEAKVMLGDLLSTTSAKRGQVVKTIMGSATKDECRELSGKLLDDNIIGDISSSLLSSSIRGKLILKRDIHIDSDQFSGMDILCPAK